MELKSTVPKMKNAFDGLTSKLDMVEERISVLEGISIESSKTKTNKTKENNDKEQNKTEQNI